MALHGIMNKEAEVATARAAEKCGIPLVRQIFQSTWSIVIVLR